MTLLLWSHIHKDFLIPVTLSTCKKQHWDLQETFWANLSQQKSDTLATKERVGHY